MMTYVTGRMMRVLYGLDAYITKSTVSHLELYFENVSDVPVAEEKLCGFEKFFKEFRSKQWGRIRSTATKELEERKNETEDIFAREKSKGLVSVLHSNKLYHIEVGMDDQTRQFSSFPWQEFSREAEDLLKKEEQKGKAYIFYPSGLLFTAFDKTITEEFPMDEVPGMVDFTVRAFTFKKYFRDRSQAILNHVSKDFRKNNKKLFVQLFQRLDLPMISLPYFSSRCRHTGHVKNLFTGSSSKHPECSPCAGRCLNSTHALHSWK